MLNALLPSSKIPAGEVGRELEKENFHRLVTELALKFSFSGALLPQMLAQHCKVLLSFTQPATEIQSQRGCLLTLSQKSHPGYFCAI